MGLLQWGKKGLSGEGTETKKSKSSMKKTTG